MSGLLNLTFRTRHVCHVRNVMFLREVLTRVTRVELKPRIGV